MNYCKFKIMIIQTKSEIAQYAENYASTVVVLEGGV